MLKNVKYWIGLFLFVVMFWCLNVSAFQQQGFTTYQEWYNPDGFGVTFDCEQQCIVLLWTLGGNDYLQLNGIVEGQGALGFGFLMGEQVVPWPMINVQWQWNMDQKFNFSELQFFSQIPKEAQVVLIVQGKVSGSEVKAKLKYLSFFEKFDQAWKDFWKMEPMTPYTINLRYGVKILGSSIVQYWYILFILIALYIRLFSKKNKQKKGEMIFYFGIGIFLFLGLRNLITNAVIVQQWVKNYSTNQTLFDLGDYIPFTDQIRKKLELDVGKKECTIQVNTYQERPFKAHRESVYLKPCKIVLTWSEAEYIVYYHVPIGSGDVDKKILLQMNDNYLLQNK